LISIHSNKFLNLQSQHITVIERQRGWWVSEPTPTSVHHEGWMDGWMISDHSNSFLLSSSSLANHGS
jgi:hypothetical protein